MAPTVRSGAILLLLFLGVCLVDVASAKSRQERQGALDAGKPKKARRGAAGAISRGPRAGRDKSEVFAECFNAMQENMGPGKAVKRQKADAPAKARARREQIISQSETCPTLSSLSCSDSDNGTASSNTTSGRRLMELVLGVNVQGMSSEDARGHLRDLLQAASEEEGFEPASIDNEDEDDNAFAESVAANLSDEDLDDFCTISGANGNNTVTEALRMFANPDAVVVPRLAAASGPALAGFGRMSLADKLKVLEEASSYLAQPAGNATLLAATPRQGGSDCRTNTTGQKKSTKDKVTCDGNLLASPITPGYQADNGGSYVAAVDALKTRDWIDTSTNGGRFAEYTNADKWGENFVDIAIRESVVSVLNTAFEAATSGCDIASSIGTWAGTIAGVAVKPAKAICGGVALGLKLVLVGAVQLLVEVQKYTATAASNHDLIILGQEVEAIGENALSVIYNQKKTFAEMRTLGDSTRDDLKSTTTAIVAAAGDATQAIVDLEGDVSGLQTELRDALNALEAEADRRYCDIQNALAAMHNTINYLQRLLLVPEGQRPGYNQQGAYAACALAPPASCAQPDATAAVTAAASCNAGVVNG